MQFRCEVHHEGKTLAFGNDCACGEFLMIWDTTKYREPDCDNVIVDEDRSTGMTRQSMLSLISQHGFVEEELGHAYEMMMNSELLK